MAKKSRLQLLLDKLAPNESSKSFRTFDEGVERLKSQLKETITTKTLEEVSTELTKFRKKEYIKPIISTVEDIKGALEKEKTDLFKQLQTKLVEIDDMKKVDKQVTEMELATLNAEIASLRKQITNLDERNNQADETDFSIKTKQDNLEQEISNLNTLLADSSREIIDLKQVIQDLSDKQEKNRLDFIQRLSNHGGGNQNRQILVEGVDVLTKYTDINLYGTSSSILATVNDVFKRVDIGIQGGTTPSVVTYNILTESGNNLTTESGNLLVLE